MTDSTKCHCRLNMEDQTYQIINGWLQNDWSNLERSSKPILNIKKTTEDSLNQMIELGDAEIVPEEQNNKDTKEMWYIPHHGVYHK